MASIYDITGEKFFVPLASKNRKAYIDTILFLHKLINELFEAKENEKNKIVEALTSHLNDSVDLKIHKDDSTDDLEEGLDNKSKAQLLINKLEDYGWLLEEAVGNNKKTLDFNDYCYNFIALIEELIANRKPQYTSYIKTINNVIYKFDYSTVDDLEIVDKTLNDFVVALRGLRSSIQRFYKNITKNKGNNLEELLDEFTGEYKEYFFDSAYLNLKIRDNVDAEIPKIEEQLDLIFDDYFNMQKLISAQMKEKGFEDYNVAFDRINSTKKRIIANIRTIPSIIEMIDSKNEKYVTRTVSVIIHLINRGDDIEGILNRLINYVKDNDVEDNYLALFEMKHYTFNALSKPRKYNPKPKPEMIPIEFIISDEAKSKTLEILKEDKKYNIHAVNDFVKNFLGNLKVRRISELDIKSKYEFIMIVSIMIYSKLPNAIYELELLNERINKNGVSFNDFLVKENEVKL